MSTPLLKSHSTFSLRKSIIKPLDLINTCKKFGYTSVALCEKGNIYSYVKHYKACVDAKIKPIIGIDLYINDNDNLSNLTLLCKNKKGFNTLLKIIAKSNSVGNFNTFKEVASINIKELASLCDNNFIVYSGCYNSWVSRNITNNYEDFAKTHDYSVAKSLVKENWKSELDNRISTLQEIFGKENFFLEYQNVDKETLPASEILGKIVVDASRRLKIPAICTCRPHYIKKQDYEVQKALICIDKKSSISNVIDVLEYQNDLEYYPFFRNDNSYLFSPVDFENNYSKEFLENNQLVDSLIEEYSILDNPKIPNYNCPNNLDALSYLKQLCRDGWDKVPIGEDKKYQERLNYEMKVVTDVGLAPYFLVVWDVFRFAKSNGWLSSVRGSAGGSIITYLIGLSEADPVKYNLVFSRFYNEGRNQIGKISWPDIDIDTPIEHRPTIVEYLREKYNRNNVGNIATFGSLKGASSLKEILRIKNVCSADEANQISKLIIDEHKISDELEELRKEGEEASILGWSIENVKALNQYVNYDDSGELVGDYAQYFEQAIKLEGCKRNLSKHACGVVVSQERLDSFCPMVRDKNSDELMVGLEMGDVEAIGGMKLDLLGVASISDIMETIRLVREGDLINE